MHTLHPSPPPRNPIADLLAEAIKIAVTDPDTIAAMRTLFAPSCDDEAFGPLTRAGLARRWRVSTSTIDRMVAAGMPSTGSRRLRRFELAECERWRHEHTGPARDALDDEVGAIARHAGLRVAGGA